jgi:integrase/recombinase XerD
MKIKLQKVLDKTKTKQYLTIRTFKGYKVVDGVRKQDKTRESHGFIWVKPKGVDQKTHNKKAEMKVKLKIKKKQLEFETGLYNVYNPENRKINFTEYWLDWADKHCSNERKRSNFSQFKTSLKHFKEFTGDQLIIGDIDFNLCDGFIKYLSKEAVKYSNGKPLKTSSINTFYKKFDLVVWSLYNKDLLIGSHPAPRKLLNIPKIIQKKKEYLTIDEINTLDYKECSNEVYAKAFLFCCWVGCRSGDLANLKWKDIRLENGKIYVYYVMQKGDNPIKVPLMPNALELMGDRKNDNELVFPHFTYHGTNNEKLYAWLKMSGINKDLCFHSSKASFITNMIHITKGNVEMTQRLVGHKDIRTTQGYNKLTNEGKEDAIDALQKASEQQ